MNAVATEADGKRPLNHQRQNVSGAG